MTPRVFGDQVPNVASPFLVVKVIEDFSQQLDDVKQEHDR